MLNHGRNDFGGNTQIAQINDLVRVQIEGPCEVNKRQDDHFADPGLR